MTTEAELTTGAFRVCDRRWPFLWSHDGQPSGRWHGPGEGPCHYLSNTAEAAWAEFLRHETITTADELEDVERGIWEVGVVPPSAQPSLPEETLLGGKSTYPDCQAEARRLRSGGAKGLTAPSAAVLPSGTALYGVDTSGEYIVAWVPATTYAFFGEAGLHGLHLAYGRPDPTILDRVRHFCLD